MSNAGFAGKKMNHPALSKNNRTNWPAGGHNRSLRSQCNITQTPHAHNYLPNIIEYISNFKLFIKSVNIFYHLTCHGVNVYVYNFKKRSASVYDGKDSCVYSITYIDLALQNNQCADI